MKNRLLTAAAVVGSVLLPALASAKEEDDLKLSEQELTAQRNTFAVIGIIVVAAIAFYYFRRWQTLRSGNIVEGSNRGGE